MEDHDLDEMSSGGGTGHWMAHAVRHRGALRQAAHRAGKSTMEFAHEHKNASGTLGRRARLALTFAKFRPK